MFGKLIDFHMQSCTHERRNSRTVHFTPRTLTQHHQIHPVEMATPETRNQANAAANADPPNPPAPFTTLPPELRLEIYHQLFTSLAAISRQNISPETSNQISYATAILYTSQQISAEAGKVFFRYYRALAGMIDRNVRASLVVRNGPALLRGLGSELPLRWSMRQLGRLKSADRFLMESGVKFGRRVVEENVEARVRRRLSSA